MCGITGIFQYQGPALTEEQYQHLDAMGHRLRFRGPDDNASFFLDKTIGMQFRRLSIIDIQGGRQPFVSGDGQICVMVNEEIYNFQTLKKTELTDYPFKSKSDCEVVLALYLKFGIDFLSRLNGMFGISIYDNRKKSLYLIRDRLGIKPLFYAQTPKKELLFASEIKALAAHPGCPREFDWIAAFTRQKLYQDNFATMQSTCFTGIYQVEPGTYIEFNENGQKITRWWDVKSPTLEQQKADRRKIPELIDEYYHLLNDSVSLCLMSDADVGIALSGGVDSVMISALSAQSKNLETFTVLSESTYLNGDAGGAQIAAQILKLPNHQLYFPVQHNLIQAQDIKRILYDLEMPITMEQVYKYLLYRKIKETFPNLKTLLMGQGSDEFNGGYGQQLIKMYMPDLAEDKFNWTAFMKVINSIQQKNLIEHIEPKLSILSPIINRDFLAGKIKQSIYEPWHYYQHMYRRTVMDYNLWHEDRAASANSLENRVPFLDHRIVELCFSIPRQMHQELFWNKSILRKGMEKVLTKSLTQRKKVPFFYGEGVRFTRQLAYEIMAKDDNAFIREALFENPEAQCVFNMDAIKNIYLTTQLDSSFERALELFNYCCMGLLARGIKYGLPEPVEPITCELSWYTLKEYEQNVSKFIQE
jgi:asparagine synthase (glutamine-hydrolysing)